MFKNNFSKAIHYLDRYGKIDIACIKCLSIDSYIYEELTFIGENLLCKNCHELTCIPINNESFLFKKNKNERLEILGLMNNMYINIGN